MVERNDGNALIARSSANAVNEDIDAIINPRPEKKGRLQKNKKNSHLLSEDMYRFCDPRIRRVKNLSCGARHTGNVIFQGDNLDIMDSIIPLYKDKIRCVYIDPPYNNQESYTHYHDKFEHAEWLDSLSVRLERFKTLLSDDGSLWVSIDDRELHYLKVAIDQVFGRKNFVTTIVWEQRTTRENRKIFSNNHEYVLVYAKNIKAFKETHNRLALNNEIASRYKNPDNDSRGSWQSVSANVQAGHATPSQFYKIVAPNGRCHAPPKGRCWVYNQERMNKEIARNNVWFGRDGNGVPRLKRFLINAQMGMTPETLWTAAEVGTNDAAKKHLIELFPNSKVFDTPKPESLLQRILHIATNKGDLVLDAYLGSGTTAAVAHKMDRRYIGIEKGAHAVTHCARRLKFVVKGEKGGISNSLDWTGGGGYDFCRLI